jgi:hypothetical protein
VGEALAPVYRKTLLPSYGIAIAYVLGDTYDKTVKAYTDQLASREGHQSPSTLSINYSKIATESGDTFVWQMLASVTIPGESGSSSLATLLTTLTLTALTTLILCM